MNMKWLLFIIVAFLPSYLIRFQIGTVPTTALEIIILLAFVAWIAQKLRNSELAAYFKNFPRLWLVAIILWLVAATLAAAISPDKRAALGIWKAYFLEPIFLLFIFVDAIRTVDDLKFIFSGLGLSALYISAFAIAQRFFGFPIPHPWQSELRVTSIFEYPNAVGLFLAPLVPLFVGESRIWNIEYRTRNKVFFSLAALFSITAIVLAKSEGAIVGVATGLFVLGLLWSKKTWIITIVAATLVTIAIYSVPVARSYIIEKATFEDWSGYVRKKMWGETWEMLKDRPILGAGLDGYKTAIAPYHKTKAIEIFMYPHNIIFNFWSELGVLGLAIFFLILCLFFKTVFRAKKLLTTHYLLLTALAAAMTALIVHGLVDVPYFKNDLAILFWLLIGSLIVVYNNCVHSRGLATTDSNN